MSARTELHCSSENVTSSMFWTLWDNKDLYAKLIETIGLYCFAVDETLSPSVWG